MSDDEKTRRDPPDEVEATRTRAGAPPPSPPSADLPASIGRYRVLRKLGAGGMGVVYEAEQASPRRRVAVKVVRGGEFVDEGRIRMFQREADTLARLKHPGIGSIYESGRTADGHHFFAMELVRGPTLDTFLENRPPVTTEEELRFRLALACRIADAVQYAHQRGVIHRDLKPSNIIVTDEVDSGDPTTGSAVAISGMQLPSIKILDFGLARITEGDLAATTMATEIGVIKGTLPYMSPEQARGIPEAIDLRTDVYALGVILYEMLANRRPHDVQRRSLVEAVRVICEEPVTPLIRSMSGVRRLDPDVETIVGKALEKDIDRRYASAAAFSEDVSRYLTSQPILARPPSAVYQLRKFAARNRTLVSGIVTTFVVLVAGSVASTTFGFREAEQRRAAVAARNDLEAVVDFQAGMLRGIDPRQMGQRIHEDLIRRLEGATGHAAGQPRVEVVSFREYLNEINMTDAALRLIDESVLDRAARTIEQRFGGQPLIEARLRQSVSGTYSALGLFGKAEAQTRRALEIHEEELGREHIDTLFSRLALCTVVERQGRLVESEQLSAALLEDAKRIVGPEHDLTLWAMTRLHIAIDRQGRFDESGPLVQELYEIQRRLRGDDHPETIWAVHNIGSIHRRSGDAAAGEPYLVEAVEAFTRIRGKTHHDTLWTMDSLAWAYFELGRLDEAEQLADEVRQERRRQLGEDHLQTLESVALLGNIYMRQGRTEEADRSIRDAMDKVRETLGSEHWLYLWNIQLLADLATRHGRHEEAVTLYEELLRFHTRQYGEDHTETVKTMEALDEARERLDAAGQEIL